MPLAGRTAAAYTRTKVLLRFLEQLAASEPARVDARWAETRLGLRGGDVRAFLQSLRVLGLIDETGQPTERARRTRAASRRPAAMREALRAAYPSLYERWQIRGPLGREEVEDFFKVEAGLSHSSAGPAAKLFIDLMRLYGQGETVPGEADETEFSPASPGADPALVAGAGPLPASAAPVPSLAAEPAAEEPAPASAAPRTAPLPTPPAADPAVALLQALLGPLHVDIDARWDPDRIELVFDRLERLLRVVRPLLHGHADEPPPRR